MGAYGGVIPYAEFQALRALGGLYGSVANAAALAAAASVLQAGSTLLGGFFAGYSIGQAILEGLEDPNLLPPMQNGVTGGSAGVQYILTIKSNIEPFGETTQENTITGAFGAMYFEYTQPESGRFLLITSGGTVPIFACNVEDIIEAPYVDSVRRVDGGPEAFRRTPVFPANKPVRVPLKLPTALPIPGSPFPLEITPEIYPSPELDPNQEDNKLFVPGITVKIPETGDQFSFGGTGVSIGRSTPVTPYPLEQPQKQPLPNDKKVAVDPCPCPQSEKADIEEVLCRIKTLQDEILDDGYTFTGNTIPEGVGGSVSNIQAELVQANVFLSTFPLNVSRQYYQALDSDVIYGGWFSWTKEGRAGERIPLSFENNSFYPPPEVDGFKYAFNRGCSGSGSYVTRVKKDYVDNC